VAGTPPASTTALKNSNEDMKNYQIANKRLCNFTFWGIAAILFALVSGPTAKAASAGAIDPGFLAPEILGPGTVRAVVRQPDGKLLIGGQFLQIDGVLRKNIARVNSDGTLDPTFNPGAGAEGGFLPKVAALLLQNDGKVIVGGSFSTFNGVARTNLVRLASDGSIDASFFGSVNGEVKAIVPLAGGKFMIGGYFSLINGSSRKCIARLNSDGTLDTSFNAGSILYGNSYTGVKVIAVQVDGKLIIAGDFSTVAGIARPAIARLLADGALDTTFAPQGDGYIYSMALQSDNKILIGGGFNSFGGTYRGRLARLNSDGSVDLSFNQTVAPNGSVEVIALASNGSVLVGGYFPSSPLSGLRGFARLTSTGSLDPQFEAGPIYRFEDRVYAIATEPDGRLLIGGTFQRYNGVDRAGIARLQTNGVVETAFQVRTEAPGEVTRVALQADGKLIIAGNFFKVGGLQRNRIARLYTDGTFDPGFDTGAGPDDFVNALEVQPDGKIILGGDFTTISGIQRPRLARLNADGSLDQGFGTSNGANATVRTIVLQPDGGILVGGSFSNYAGAGVPSLIRTTPSGLIDPSFFASAVRGWVSSLALQSDGKVVVGGLSLRSQGENLLRMNNDGNVDNTLSVGTNINSSVNVVALDSSGRILIGGYFEIVGGIPRYHFARLFQNGVLDQTFVVSNANTYSVPRVVIPLADGRTILGGELYLIGNRTFRGIGRILSDGSPDPDFNPGTGSDTANINSAVIQPDDKIIVGGKFQVFGGQPRSGLARLFGRRSDGPPGLLVQPVGQMLLAGSNLVLSASAEGALPLQYQWQFNGTNIAGATNSMLTLLAIQLSSSGTYRVQVSNTSGSTMSSEVSIVVLPADPLIGIQMYAGLTIFGFTNRTYRIEAADVVAPEQWATITNLVLPYTPYLFIDGATPMHQQRFYRARLLP